jgi:hypothetical protein
MPVANPLHLGKYSQLIIVGIPNSIPPPMPYTIPKYIIIELILVAYALIITPKQIIIPPTVIITLQFN